MLSTQLRTQIPLMTCTSATGEPSEHAELHTLPAAADLTCIGLESDRAAFSCHFTNVAQALCVKLEGLLEVAKYHPSYNHVVCQQHHKTMCVRKWPC